jgi:hypothetical protein
MTTMTRTVKSLNSAGITIFEAWLREPSEEPPRHILDDLNYCDEISGDYTLDTDRTFETTFSLGKYLHEEVFQNVPDPVAHGAANGMWAWLSLAMISSLLARSEKRKGKPLDIPHYIELDGSKGRRLGYRLIARTSWKLVRIHNDAAEVALGSRKSPWGEMAEQMTSRQEIFSHPSFWSVAFRLYRTPTGELRRGATSQRNASAKKDPKNKSGRGSVRRLPTTFRQFDRTYDVRHMSLDEMLKVLPKEYAKWMVVD